MSGYGVGYLMKLQSGCWLGLQLFEGLTGVGGSTSTMARLHSCQVVAGCWQEASDVFFVGFSRELLKGPYDIVAHGTTFLANYFLPFCL